MCSRPMQVRRALAPSPAFSQEHPCPPHSQMTREGAGYPWQIPRMGGSQALEPDLPPMQTPASPAREQLARAHQRATLSSPPPPRPLGLSFPADSREPPQGMHQAFSAPSPQTRPARGREWRLLSNSGPGDLGADYLPWLPAQGSAHQPPVWPADPRQRSLPLTSQKRSQAMGLSAGTMSVSQPGR